MSDDVGFEHHDAATGTTTTMLTNTVHLALTKDVDYDIEATACNTTSDIGNWFTLVVKEATNTLSITSDDPNTVLNVRLI